MRKILIIYLIVLNIIFSSFCETRTPIDNNILIDDEKEAKAKLDKAAPQLFVQSPTLKKDQDKIILTKDYFSVNVISVDDVYTNIVLFTLDYVDPACFANTESHNYYNEFLEKYPKAKPILSPIEKRTETRVCFDVAKLESIKDQLEEAAYNSILQNAPEPSACKEKDRTIYESYKEILEDYDYSKSTQEKITNAADEIKSRINKDYEDLSYQKAKYKLANIPDGEHTITITAIDTANNKTSTQVTVTVDTSQAMSFTRVWGSYIYIYAIGTVFFIIGIIILLKSKSLNLQYKYYRKWFYLLIFGIFWYAAIHGSVTLAAYLTAS